MLGAGAQFYQYLAEIFAPQSGLDLPQAIIADDVDTLVSSLRKVEACET